MIARLAPRAKRILLRFLKVARIVLVVEVLVIAAMAFGIWLWKTIHPDAYIPFVSPYSQVTTPLEPTVMNDLCQKLTDLKGDAKCRPGAVVYVPELFSAVQIQFRRGEATYQDVQAAIGSYEYTCEDVENSAGTLFQCSYDFKGDRVFPVTMLFKAPKASSSPVIEVRFSLVPAASR